MEIQKAILAISTASSGLESTLRALTPDPRSSAQLFPALLFVESALTQARTDILPTQPVSLVDAIDLLNAVDTMVKSLKIMVMSSLIQRQTLDQLGATPVLLKAYTNHGQLTVALGQAFLSKVPAEDVASAEAAFKGATATISMGVVSLGNAPLTMPAPQSGAPQQGGPPSTAPPPNTPPPTPSQPAA
ncbi:hypothetical protein LX32DRAFT_693767 [Colletotrichum zoysiae]|uniref:Cell wall protein n=1 Tax=Colletotrichum zoysiae TaxID=1216348 RepID=A0AAD9HH57_9PEZI|nr:hypothetical protein LX32DRAFT_693767 [Colletotrichum zoysiae]